MTVTGTGVIRSILMAPSKQHLVIAPQTGDAQLWHIMSNSLVHTFKGKNTHISRSSEPNCQHLQAIAIPNAFLSMNDQTILERFYFFSKNIHFYAIADQSSNEFIAQ